MFDFISLFLHLYDIVKHAVSNDRSVSKELGQI